MKLNKYCKKCNKETLHRSRIDKRLKNSKLQYYCAICSKNTDKKSRINNWWSYLAMKANSRKLKGSQKLSKIDIEYLAASQNYKCALTGEKLDPNEKWWKPSLDRIDSNLPYTIANIRIVAWIVNHCRGDLTDKEFLDMCKKVSNYDKNT